MAKHASRKPNRKFKVPQHERIARARKRFQAQQHARRLIKAEELLALEELKKARYADEARPA